VSPFIGRDPELRRVIAALEGVIAGGGRGVRIVGEAGIGKTRLAEEAMRTAEERGAAVAWGRCWEAGGAPAFWPWTQILRGLGIDDVFGSSTAASASDAEAERFRLFDTVAQGLVKASRTRPLVIAIDDAHAADIPSLLLLRFVAQNLRSAPILVLVTQREVEARVRPDAGDLLARTSRDFETIMPRRLDEVDVAAWLKEVGRAESEAGAVHRATEGNPLFVRELLEMANPDLVSSDAVRAAISEHLGRLPPDTRRVLEIAAVLGRESMRTDLSRIAGDIDAAVKKGCELGVLEARTQNHVTFRHVLLRDELYASIDPGRRDELHAQAAEMYAARGDLGDDALGPAAHHELKAARGGDPTRAVERVRRAAERAVARAAYEEAAALLERAVAVLEERGALTSELLLEWGEALLLSGLGPRGRDACARAAALAKSQSDGPMMIRAALVYGSEILTGTRDERMIALLRDALAALPPGDSPLRARVMGRLAAALIPTARNDREPIVLATEALRMVRATGQDPLARLQVLQSYGGAIAFQSGTTERHELVNELLEVATVLDKPAIIASTLPWAMGNELELSGIAGFDRRLAQMVHLAERLRQPHYQARIPIARILRASAVGAWDEAERQIREAQVLAENADVPQPRFWLAVALTGYHFARRDPALLRRDRPSITAVFDKWQWSGRIFSALTAALAGEADVIRGQLREGMALMEIQSVLPAAGAVAWACVLVGDADIVAELEPAIAAQHALGNRLIMLAACAASLGPTALLLAEMRSLLGRDARALYEEALELSEKMGARTFADLARAKLGAPKSAPPKSAPTLELTQDGEIWTLRAGDESLTLKASKGVTYLSILIAQPHDEFHVTQLVGAGELVTGDAGPQLDEKAKATYRRRASDLRAELDEATANNDVGRTERLRAELEALGEELARAVGLGGRDRKAASDVERMRVNVQRRLRDAIERVRAHSPTLGRYLDASIRTGSFCSYRPVWNVVP
jgi:hypothetical protein